jgi:hypothetical protein
VAKAGRKSIPKSPFEWRGWRGATRRGRPILFEARPDLLAEEPPRKQRRVVEAPQGSRLQIKLIELFGDRIPSEKELSNGELVAIVVKAFKDDPKTKKTGLRIPERKTILHHAGRIKRKK